MKRLKNDVIPIKGKIHRNLALKGGGNKREYVQRNEKGQGCKVTRRMCEGREVSKKRENKGEKQEGEIRRQKVRRQIIVMLKQWPTLYVKERRLCYKGERAVSHERGVHARISCTHECKSQCLGFTLQSSHAAFSQGSRFNINLIYGNSFLQENN